MSYTVQGGVLSGERFHLDSTDPVAIGNTSGTGALVISIAAAEVSGGTPTLSLYVQDGADKFYLRKEVAMTSKQLLVIELLLPLSDAVLYAETNTTDAIDIHVTESPRNALSNRAG